MRLISLIAFAFIGAAAAGAAGPRQAPAPMNAGLTPLSGIVLSAAQPAAPVRYATVIATDISGRLAAQTTATDDDGKFSFAGLPTGRYDVSAIKPGYLKTSYGMTRPERTGTPVTISAAEPPATVTLRMWRGAVIAGLLSDSGGRPLTRTMVTVRRFQFVDGVRTLATQAINGATTDDRGMYRVFDLPPGEYAVFASASGGGRSTATPAPRQISSEEVDRALRAARGGSLPGAPPAPATPPAKSPPPPSPVLGYAPVYFPGTPLVLQATPIQVEAGEERTGVDFVVPLVPMATVGGSIVAAGGDAVTDLDVNVSLVARSAPGNLVISRSMPVGAGGTFLFNDVAPGDYVVSARATPKPTATAAARDTRGWWASSATAVNGANVAGVSLVLEPGITIKGRVVFDGTDQLPVDAATINVRLTSRSGEPGVPRSQTATVTEQTFTIPAVVPGDYVLSAAIGGRAAMSSWSLKSVTVGALDATDRPFTITPEQMVGPVIVAFTNRRTTVTGVFQDAAGRPASGFFIVALPRDRALWSAGARRIVQTRPATDGKFSMAGLPAGEYALAVTTDLVAADLADPSFLAQLLAAGVVNVTITDGATVTQDIRVAASAR
jgi:uncharacterized protein (DUF2141 family)